MENKLFICNKIPCSYYFILILATILEDGKKGEVKREKLLEATRILMNHIDNDYFKEIFESLEIVVTFKYDDLETELTKFLDEYRHLVYLKDDKICLYNHVNYQILMDIIEAIEEKEEIDNFKFELRMLRKKEDFKKCLNLTEIRKLYHSLIAKEAKVEQLYLSLLTTNKTKITEERIKKLLTLRNEIYKKIILSGVHVIEAIQDEEPQLDIQINNDFPIDFSLYENSEFYLEEECLDGIRIPLEENLASVFQMAIFTSFDLAEPKFCNDLTLLRIDAYNDDPETSEIFQYYENDENFERIYGTQFDSDIIFYLTYVEKLNELMDLYGFNQELEMTKFRLLYSLDDAGLYLFAEENRRKELEKKLSDPDMDPIFNDGYSHFQNESLFFIQDIFEGKKQNFPTDLKKVAFIATYYELAKDEKIKQELSKYISKEHCFEYYRFIVSSSKIKKLVN